MSFISRAERCFPVTASLLMIILLLTGIQRVHAEENTDELPPASVHIVHQGENLGEIADHYQLSENSLRAANALPFQAVIFPGQRLIIPNGITSGGLDDVAAYELVGIDETLASIAARRALSINEIAIMNGIVNPDLIQPGGYLRLPFSDPDNKPASTLLTSQANAILRAAVFANLNPYVILASNELASLHLPPENSVIRLPAGEGFSGGLQSPWQSVTLAGAPLMPGHSAAIRITTTEKGSITLFFLDQEMPVFSSADGLHHETIFGINRYASPGIYQLRITFTSETGERSLLERSVALMSGEYPSEIIRLSPEIETILTDDTIVQGEVIYTASSMTGYSDEMRWDQVFYRPAMGILTSTFGTNRYYDNTSLNTYHSGSDIATDEGTPVIAPASGRVVDTGLLDIRGYIIILDHGRGVYTGYWHLASIQVRPGDFVTAGQQIGTVGNTGASTSAHLHWEMRVNGVLVDAMQWLRQPFP